MNLHLTYNSIYKIKSILLIILMILGLLTITNKNSWAQGFVSKNKVFLIGQVVNELNGAPIKNHKLAIVADSTLEPNLHYNKIVYTDHEGYYYDTVYTYNNKGALIISTKDFNENNYDTTVYFRFNWSEDNILFANFIIPAEPPPLIYQANFYYVRNPNGQNEQEYKFIDITNSDDIISWEWNFGDGDISTEQNPTHVFEEVGLNRVELTVEIQSSPFVEPFKTKLVKVINVTMNSYFHIGGHVFAGYFPIDIGHAYLYKIENNTLIFIDTAIFNDTLGFYLFYQLIEGDYIIKADLDPSSEMFNQFMSTYYGDILHWEEADTIHHHSSNFEYDINLIPNEKSMAGPGTLAGKINYLSGGDGKMYPANNISIILYDNDNVPVDICHSDEEGQFALQDLDMDIYYLFAEVTGKYAEPLYVELEGENTEITKIEFVIDETTVTGVIGYSAVSENSFLSNISEGYPNPAIDVIHIDLNSSRAMLIQYTILNTAGIILESGNKETDIGINQFSFNVAYLSAGMYFIHFFTQESRLVTIKFVK